MWTQNTGFWWWCST